MINAKFIQDQVTETELFIRSLSLIDEQYNAIGINMYEADIESTDGELCIFNMPLAVENRKGENAVYSMPYLADIICDCADNCTSYDFDFNIGRKHTELFEASLSECGEVLHAPEQGHQADAEPSENNVKIVVNDELKHIVSNLDELFECLSLIRHNAETKHTINKINITGELNRLAIV